MFTIAMLGTRLGRQELEGEVTMDSTRSLWNYTNLDTNRVSKHPDQKQIVVAMNPTITADDSNEIIVCLLGLMTRIMGML
jgi:phage terminase large subunit-like protein